MATIRVDALSYLTIETIRDYEHVCNTACTPFPVNHMAHKCDDACYKHIPTVSTIEVYKDEGLVLSRDICRDSCATILKNMNDRGATGIFSSTCDICCGRFMTKTFPGMEKFNDTLCDSCAKRRSKAGVPQRVPWSRTTSCVRCGEGGLKHYHNDKCDFCRNYQPPAGNERALGTTSTANQSGAVPATPSSARLTAGPQTISPPPSGSRQTRLGIVSGYYDMDNGDEATSAQTILQMEIEDLAKCPTMAPVTPSSSQITARQQTISPLPSGSQQNRLAVESGRAGTDRREGSVREQAVGQVETDNWTDRGRQASQASDR